MCFRVVASMINQALLNLEAAVAPPRHQAGRLTNVRRAIENKAQSIPRHLLLQPRLLVCFDLRHEGFEVSRSTNRAATTF